jgi:hypothetical protein
LGKEGYINTADVKSNMVKKSKSGNASWRRRLFVIFAVVVVWAVLMLTDLYRTRLDEPPLFAVPLLHYDSGSVDYYGLFYKIWKDVNILNGDTEYYMTAWFVPKFISPNI